MAIMIPNVIKNFTHRPRTRLYPIEVRQLPLGVRGHIEFDMEKCIFCSICAKRCPSDAIVVDRKAKTLTFDPLRCIVCEACVEGCTKDSISMFEKWRSPVIARYNEVYKPAEKEETI